jgi:phosphinothricin tripeptide acetyl hydrolase
MASEALETIVGLLRGANPIAGATIQQIRASTETFSAATPVPEGVTFTPVDAGGVAAEWNDAQGARTDRVVIYFHGGGYCIGSIDTHRGLTARISLLANMRVLSVDYRLAPENPHPAAVEDAVAAYRFVLDSGIAPGKIALAGDSAGGGLTLAALLAIRDQGLPLPGCGACISAWTDMTASGDSMKTKADEDPLIGEGESLQMMLDAYVGAGGDKKAPLASPLFADLAGLPPLLLQVGTAEVLLDDSTRLAARAEKAGVDVSLKVWQDMFHVWHAFAEMLPEGQQATQELADFVDAKLV